MIYVIIVDFVISWENINKIGMSDFPTNYQQNVHQIGQTIAWSVLLNFMIISINLRFYKKGFLTHALLGYTILLLTYTFIIYFLAPYGFNINTNNFPLLLYIHAIIGCALLAFVALEVIGGILSKMTEDRISLGVTMAKRIKTLHRIFGYFLAFVYKVNVFWSWGTGVVFYILILW